MPYTDEHLMHVDRRIAAVELELEHLRSAKDQNAGREERYSSIKILENALHIHKNLRQSIINDLAAR